MKRLIIIVEGETEESFVNEILKPHFQSLGIYNLVQCFKTKHSNGGVSKYQFIQKDILGVIYEKDAVVTTMIDFYAIPADFPKYTESLQQHSHSDQVDFLEQEMKKDIEHTQSQLFDNFIPYIQLHEFEALLFSSMSGFDALFEKSELKHKELQDLIDRYPNPEEINNGVNTAPSKRLKNLIAGYDKVVFGMALLKEIRMDVVLQKCPHFNLWIEKIKNAIQ